MRPDTISFASSFGSSSVSSMTTLLEGLKLVGFSVWERQAGPGRNVTFPAAVRGERQAQIVRTPAADRRRDGAEQDRELILKAFQEYAERAEVNG